MSRRREHPGASSASGSSTGQQRFRAGRSSHLAGNADMESNLTHVNLDTLTSDLNLTGSTINVERQRQQPPRYDPRDPRYYSAGAAAMVAEDDNRSHATSSNLSSYFHDEMPPGTHKSSHSQSHSAPSHQSGNGGSRNGGRSEQVPVAAAAGGEEGGEMTMVWFEGQAGSKQGSGGSGGSGQQLEVDFRDETDRRSSASSSSRQPSYRRHNDLEKIDEQNGGRIAGSSNRSASSSRSSRRYSGSSGSVSRSGGVRSTGDADEGEMQRHVPQWRSHLTPEDNESRGSGGSSELADDDDDDNEALLALAGAASATALAGAALHASRSGGSKRDLEDEPELRAENASPVVSAAATGTNEKEDLDAWLRQSELSLQQSKLQRTQRNVFENSMVPIDEAAARTDKDGRSGLGSRSGSGSGSRSSSRSGAGAGAAAAVAAAATVTTAAALTAQQPEVDEAEYDLQGMDDERKIENGAFGAQFHVGPPSKEEEGERHGVDDDLDDWGLDPQGSLQDQEEMSELVENRNESFTNRSQIENAYGIEDGGGQSAVASYWQSKQEEEGMGLYGGGHRDDGNEDIEKKHNKSLKRRKNIKKAFIAGWVIVLILIIASISVAVRSRNRANNITPPATPVPTPAPSPGPPTVTTPPTPAPAFPPPPFNDRRGDIIGATGSISGEDIVQDPTTPQHQATEWMIEDDPLMLQADDPNFVQRYVLATLVFATDGEQSWFECGPPGSTSLCATEEERFLSGNPECDWYGIACDMDFVTQVSLIDNGLRGSLIQELAELQSLQVLSLSRNELESSIPPALGEIATLEQLSFERNALVGEIPSTFGGLTSLVSLDLSRNDLSGTLPKEMFTSNLNLFNVGGNELTGSIPNELFLGSPDLIRIDLSSNRLSGSISRGLGSLARAEFIKLSNNRLEGKLSGAIFTRALKSFDVEINNLSGKVPDGLFEATSLTHLNLGKNQFEGTLSTQFGELLDMELLLLYLNDFSGTVPSSIGDLSSLVVLDIGYTDLEGSMPEEICELLDMSLVYLASDCAKRDGEPPDFECDCCTQCYPVL